MREIIEALTGELPPSATFCFYSITIITALISGASLINQANSIIETQCGFVSKDAYIKAKIEPICESVE